MQHHIRRNKGKGRLVELYDKTQNEVVYAMHLVEVDVQGIFIDIKIHVISLQMYMGCNRSHGFGKHTGAVAKPKGKTYFHLLTMSFHTQIP